MERMFDTFPAPDRSRQDAVPPDWPLLLVRAEPPGDGERCSTRRRDVVVAVRAGGWEEAVVWAWAGGDGGAGGTVQWRCQIEVGGHISWYVHDDRLIHRLDTGY